jgi:hypothetical protein
MLVLASASSAVTASNDGRVMGSIRLCGGPAPGRCFDQDGTVVVFNSRHRIAATQRTRRTRFSFALPPGNYTLRATTGDTRGQRSVAIKAHRTLHANVVIPVP